MSIRPKKISETFLSHFRQLARRCSPSEALALPSISILKRGRRITLSIVLSAVSEWNSSHTGDEGFGRDLDGQLDHDSENEPDEDRDPENQENSDNPDESYNSKRDKLSGLNSLEVARILANSKSKWGKRKPRATVESAKPVSLSLVLQCS